MTHTIRKYLEIVAEAAGNRTAPLVVVDVQPEYSSHIHFAPELMRFVNQHRGPILMLVNAEETGVSQDTKDEIAEYWIRNGLKRAKLERLRVFDKGYGHLRAWMDFTDEETIVTAIRFMMSRNVNDSREIDAETWQEVLGDGWRYELADEPLILGWIDVRLLRSLPHALLCGGGRDECLAEVRLMFEALEIPYAPLEEFIYG